MSVLRVSVKPLDDILMMLAVYIQTGAFQLHDCVKSEARNLRSVAMLLDPTVLYGSEASIRAAAANGIAQVGSKHVLNLGNGVKKDTPEAAVAA